MLQFLNSSKLDRNSPSEIFINYLLKNTHEQIQKSIKQAQVSFPILKVLFSIFHTIFINTKQYKNPWTLPLTMTTSTPHFTMSKHQHKLTVQMEANNVLRTFQLLGNTKLNHAKISLYWVTAAMEISVNLHMETMNLTLFFVEVFIKRRNAKTFGKKDFVCMEFVVNFFIQNVRKDPVMKIIQSI